MHTQLLKDETSARSRNSRQARGAHATANRNKLMCHCADVRGGWLAGQTTIWKHLCV